MVQIALFLGLAAMLVVRGLRSVFFALYVTVLVGVCFGFEKLYPTLHYMTDYALYAVAFLHIVGINMAVFLVYWYDKRAARQHKYRVPEKTLHGFALVGGTPFALLARLVLRHKTKKVSFRIDFWVIAAAQVALLVYITRYFLR